MMVNAAIIAELCVYVLTWNVASKQPQNLDMNAMLSLNGPTSCPGGQLPDLYVIGFQEVKLTVNPLRKENEWSSAIKQYLSVHDYVKLGTEKLQGILLNVWSKSKHLKQIKNIETAVTKTGFGGVWGNKGAASLRMTLYGTPTAFVVSHLAAHDDKNRERIEDYNKIFNFHSYKSSTSHSIDSHDLIIWSGDLNFRINGRDSATDISNKVREGKLDDLFARDQLEIARKSGQAFKGFSESRPMFPPTFKFKQGTSDYDLKRRPAWCDRILYRVKNTNRGIVLALQQLSYKSYPDYVYSDHKPVSAEFLLSITGK